ncbi:hypothetical protein ACHQM5_016094 [Ranunculus cassubicifolius]
MIGSSKICSNEENSAKDSGLMIDLNKSCSNEENTVKASEKGLNIDLNKIIFGEGELHPDPDMQDFIISMLKVMYPEFF